MDTQIIQGREITPSDIELVRRLLADNPSWTRSRLSQELCRLWHWQNGAGQLKDMAARALLRKLEAQGVITLPRKRNRGGGELWSKQQAPEQLALPCSPIDTPIVQGSLSSIQPVSISLVSDDDELVLFTSLLRRYHYLGYNRSVGQNLKYLVYDRDRHALGCLYFGAPAWRCADRDRFIGWSDSLRAERLNLIANNMRFLLLPQIPHLASHVLSRVLRRIRRDWYNKYGQPLVLVETFVDQTRFAGTCYKAANWILIGQTKGRSRNDRHLTLHVPIKQIYVYPLIPNFREVLAQ